MGLVGQPYGQHGQQGPSQRKAEQHHTREDVLPSRDERDGDESNRNSQSSGHRYHADRADADPGRRLRASVFLRIGAVHRRDHDETRFKQC